MRQRNTGSSHRLIFSSAVLLSNLIPSAGYAAELEEVIVTGDPLQRSTLETVSSISVVPDVQLQQQNIRDLYDLLLRTPNLNAAKEDKFSIRGISNEGIGTGGTGRPTVSVFIDGIRQFARGANTWDVQQVEIYRGPQSTAFGPGSLAGAIVVKTRDPNFEEFEAAFKLGISNDGGQEVGVALSTPLGAGLAIRYTGETNQTDGEVTNSTLKDDQWQARKRYLQRFRLGFDNGGRYTALLTAQTSKLREGIEYLPLAGAEDRESTDNIDGYYLDDNELLALQQHFTLNDALKLSFLVSNSKTHNAKLGDYDVSEEDNGSFLNITDFENTTFELRASFNTEKLNGVAGLYYARDELVGTSDTVGLLYNVGAEAKVDALLGASRDAKVKAVYAEFDYDFLPRWTLTLGGRYEENQADNGVLYFVTNAEVVNPITSDTLPIDISPVLTATLFPETDRSDPSGDEVFLPKIAISYEAADWLNVFITHSRGYRSGSVDFVTTGEAPLYGPEYTSNIDIGARFSFDNASFSLTAFHVNYEDMQVGVRIDASNFQTDNAGKARAQGAELEFTVELGRGLSLFGGIGYVETAFIDYQDEEENFEGNHFPNAPRNTRNLNLSYQHDNGLFGTLSWARSDGSYTDRDNSDELKADAKDLFGLRVGYQGEKFSATLYGQNLTDKFYITDQYRNDNFGIAGVFVGDPREYGLKLSYRL